MLEDRRVLSTAMPAFPSTYQFFEVDGVKTSKTSETFEVYTDQEFWIRADFENRYTDKAGGVTMSFASFYGDYLDMKWNSVGLLNENTPDTQGYRYTLHKSPGDSIYRMDGSQMGAWWHLVEGGDGHWESWDLGHQYDEDNILSAKLRAPSKATTFNIYVRGWLINDKCYSQSDWDNADWSIYDKNPRNKSDTGYNDQQGFPAYRYTINVVGRPDLDATINAKDEPWTWGDEVEADLTVENEGKGDADAITIELIASNDRDVGNDEDHTIKKWEDQSIDADGKWEKKPYKWTLPSSPYENMPEDGSVYYYLVASTATGETDTGDNEDDDKVTMRLPRPDLVVDDIWFDPATVTDGQKFRIKATVRNAGDALAWAGLYKEQEALFYVNDEKYGEGDDYDYLEPQDTENVQSIKLDFPAGIYTVKVVADGNDEVKGEEDEENNALTKQLTVKGVKEVWWGDADGTVLSGAYEQWTDLYLWAEAYGFDSSTQFTANVLDKDTNFNLFDDEDSKDDPAVGGTGIVLSHEGGNVWRGGWPARWMQDAFNVFELDYDPEYYFDLVGYDRRSKLVKVREPGIRDIRWEDASGKELADKASVRTGEEVSIAVDVGGIRNESVTVHLWEDDSPVGDDEWLRKFTLSVPANAAPLETVRQKWNVLWYSDYGGSTPAPEYRLWDTDDPDDIWTLNNIKSYLLNVAPSLDPDFQAGVTVINHGWLPFTDASDTAPEKAEWTIELAHAVVNRAGSGSIFVHNPQSGYWVTPNARGVPENVWPNNTQWQNSNSSQDEIVLIYDWVWESDDAADGWLEGAADALFAALATPFQPIGNLDLLSRPLHFVGHSRGALINLLVAERLVASGHQIEQLTSLDPHPADGRELWGVSTGIGYNDPDIPQIVKHENVTWADNYYREDPPYESDFDFDGNSVPGAWNLQLSETVLTGEGHLQEHSDVHLWYIATIKPEAGEVEGSDLVIWPGFWTWWKSGVAFSSDVEADSHTGNIGFAKSRIGGMSRPPKTDSGEDVTVPALELFNGDFSHVALIPDSTIVDSIVDVAFSTPFPVAWIAGMTASIVKDNIVSTWAGIPGWERHGGTTIGEVENGQLALDNLDYAEHNWMYVPADTASLQFDLTVDQVSSSDELKVYWREPYKASVEIGSFSLTSNSLGGNQILVPLPDDADGTVGTIRFWLRGNSNGRVFIDNVKWSKQLPSLSIGISQSTFSEGDGSKAATGTVTRVNGQTGTALTVSVASDDTSEATVPKRVTIPAGSKSTDFAIDAENDIDADGTQTVTISVSAEGFADDSVDVQVTDDESGITGIKYNDLNGNGQRDAGEPGLPNWTILLDGQPAATTDADGNYSIVVAPGSYEVSEQKKTGWTQTDPNGSYSIDDLGTAETSSGNDFGNFELITISGKVFEDTNTNGQQDAGESNLNGWTVSLDLNNDGSVDDNRTTESDGSYGFVNVGPGTHAVSVSPPGGQNWTATTPNPSVFTATSGQTKTVHFGFGLSGEIRGIKWNDLDGDGEKDDGEPGLAGWTIYLDQNNNGQWDGADAEPYYDKTAADGTYKIVDVPSGEHTVAEVQQTGWDQTHPSENTGGHFGSYVIVDVLPSPPGGIGGLTFADGFLYSLEGYDGNIHRIDPATGDVLASYYVPGSSLHDSLPYDGPEGLATDGVHFYMATRSSNWLRKLSLEAPPNVNVLAKYSLPDWPMGLTFADGYLYYPEYLGPIRKVDPSNGAVVGALPSPSDFVYAMTYDGEHLLAGYGPGEGKIWVVSPTTGAVVETWTASGVSGIRGLAFDRSQRVLYIGLGGSGIAVAQPAPPGHVVEVVAGDTVENINFGNHLTRAVANPDEYGTDEDTALVVDAAHGVLANDWGDGLRVTDVDTSGINYGQLTWNSNGSFTYDPKGELDFLAAGDSVKGYGTYSIEDDEQQTDTASVTLTLTGINDAPVLTPAGPSSTTDVKTIVTFGLTDAINNGAGTTIITDVDDTDPAGGVALIGAVGYGELAYSLDGTTFTKVESVLSANAAILLPANALVRYTPDGINPETAMLTFRAWDETSGIAGQLADTTANGGSTAFSTATDTFSLNVTPWVKIIDDGRPGYSSTSGWSYWPNGGREGDCYYTTTHTGKTARWTFTGLASGSYQVAGTWVRNNIHASNARFVVDGGTGAPVTAYPVNQRAVRGDFSANGSEWTILADTVPVTDGTLVVTLSDSGNGIVVADAIRLQSVPPPRGVTVNLGDGVSVSEEGATSDTYTLALETEPSGDVTITIDPDSQVNLGSGAGVSVSRTFSKSNWDVPQTVTVTAVSDGISEGAHTTTITHVASGGGYNGVPVSDVTVSIADEVVPSVDIVNDGVSVQEEGPTSDSYTLVLGKQPSGNVTITIDADGQVDLGSGGGASVSKTFTPSNWNVPQTVTVTAVDDTLDEGPHTSTITHSASGGGYDGVSVSNVTASIGDNDAPFVDINRVNLSLNESGPTSDSYTVVLGTQPTGDVTISISPYSQVTIAPSQLTFSSSNWSAPQTVTVTAVDDTLEEGPHTGTIRHSASGGGYGGVSISNVAVSIADNDVPIIIDDGRPGYSSTSGWSYWPNGGREGDCYYTTTHTGKTAQWTFTDLPSGSYQVAGTWVRNNIHASNARFTIDGGTGGPVTAYPVNQRAVRGDFSANGSEWTILADTVPVTDGTLVVTLSDSGNGIVVADAIRIKSVPPPRGVTVNVGDGVSVSEEGPTSDTYTLALETEPSGNVTILVDPDSQVNLGSGSGVSVSKTFTPSNWSLPQTVTVTAVSDGIAEGAHTTTITHSASGGGYNGVPVSNVTVSIADEVVPSVNIVNDGVSVQEEGPTSDTYTLELGKQPSGNVTITIDPDSQVDLGLGAGVSVSKTFTPSNWNVPQTVTVTAVDDTLDEGPHTSTITHSASGGGYDGVSVSDVTVSIADNDAPFVDISPVSLSVNESGPTSDTYTVVLGTQPTGNVTINISPDSQVTVAPSQLTFSSSTWSTPQTVTVTAVDDTLEEGAHTGTITHSSSGGGYGGVSISNVTASIGDNDMPTIIDDGDPGFTAPGWTYWPNGGHEGDCYYTTTHTGKTAQWTFTGLASGSYQVAGTWVRNNIHASNARFTIDGGTGAPIVAYPVNQRAVPGDFSANGSEWTTLADPVSVTDGTLVVTLSDSGNGIVVADAIRIKEVTPPKAVTVDVGDGVSVSESGPTSDSYTVVLGTQPTGNVTISISPDSQVTVAPSQLTFSSSNWSTAQTVTVTAVDDTLEEGAHTGTITHSASGGGYDGVSVSDVTASIGDNDVPFVAISPVSLSVNESGPTSDTYTVVLGTQPTGNVTINISPGSQVTVAPSQLTFSSSNWSAAQTVTVTAVDDTLEEGPHTGTITHSASGGGYGGISISNVGVSIADNDLPMIIDDGKAGYSSTSGWSYWPNGGREGDCYYTTTHTGKTAQWTFTGLASGSYQVAGTWVRNNIHASNARFTIDGGTGAPIVAYPVNQRAVAGDFSANGSEWTILADPVSVTDGTLVVTLSDSGNGIVVADAIRIKLTGDAGGEGEAKVVDHPWQNPVLRHNVNDDFVVSPLDVLLLINEVNENGSRELPPNVSNALPPFWDVNGDDRITPLDVLETINYINEQGGGEGEFVPASVVIPSLAEAHGDQSEAGSTRINVLSSQLPVVNQPTINESAVAPVGQLSVGTVGSVDTDTDGLFTHSRGEISDATAIRDSASLASQDASSLSPFADDNLLSDVDDVLDLIARDAAGNSPEDRFADLLFLSISNELTD